MFALLVCGSASHLRFRTHGDSAAMRAHRIFLLGQSLEALVQELIAIEVREQHSYRKFHLAEYLAQLRHAVRIVAQDAVKGAPNFGTHLSRPSTAVHFYTWMANN